MTGTARVAPVQQTERADVVSKAIRASFLGSLPAQKLDQLLHGSAVRQVPAGEIMVREGDPSWACLVCAGALRLFLTSPSGRQVTTRCARTGEVVGISTVLRHDHRTRANVQTQTESVLLVFEVNTLRGVAHRDAEVACAFAEEVSNRAAHFSHEIANGAFLPLRYRIIRYLLDTAGAQRTTGDLVASVTQQQLADAVGSVREVIGRVLRELEAGGIVRRQRGTVTLNYDRMDHQLLTLIGDDAGSEPDARG